MSDVPATRHCVCILTLPAPHRRALELLQLEQARLNDQMARMEQVAGEHRDDERWQARWKSLLADLAAINDHMQLFSVPIVRMVAGEHHRQRLDAAQLMKAMAN